MRRKGEKKEIEELDTQRCSIPAYINRCCNMNTSLKAEELFSSNGHPNGPRLRRER